MGRFLASQRECIGMARDLNTTGTARYTRAAVITLALALLAVSACARTSGAAPRPTSSPSPTGVAKWTQAAASFPPTATPIAGQPLPAFSDWRATYFGADGVLHAATLDGQIDIAGPRLPGLSMYGFTLASAGVAPDGHRIAYATNSLHVVDVADGLSAAGNSVAPHKMYWSPDGTQIALGDNVGGFSIIDAADGTSRDAPGAIPSWYRVLDGWIDATHILIDGIYGHDQSFMLGALNIVTGQVRQLVSLPVAQNEDYFVTLSPDGREALVYGEPYRAYPFTPTADEIDTATGTVRALPHIAPLTAGMFESFAWRPGSHTVAVTTNQMGAPTWLLDLDADSAVSVALYQSIGSIAGWSPDGMTLIFSTGYQLEIGSGPFTITAVSLAPTGAVAHVTVLTRNAMSFPFIGFIRTA